MFKKRMMLIGATVPFILLNGCSIGSSQVAKSVPIVKIDMSRYQKQTAEGTFEGVLSKKFVEIKIDGKTKTFAAQDEALKQINGVKNGSDIQFVFALDQNTDDNVIYSVLSQNGNKIDQEIVKKPKEEVKDKLKKVENVNKIKLEVDYPSNTKVVDAVENGFFGGKFDVIDGYQWDGSALTNGDTKIQFEQVQDTPENDVQRERWRAAGILKEVGDLKEDTNSNRDNVKFLFYTETENAYKEIMVMKNQYGYFRVETDTTRAQENIAFYELTAMINSIK